MVSIIPVAYNVDEICLSNMVNNPMLPVAIEIPLSVDVLPQAEIVVPIGGKRMEKCFMVAIKTAPRILCCLVCTFSGSFGIYTIINPNHAPVLNCLCF